MVNPEPKLQFLESIRGVAALVVVVHHLVLSFWPLLDDPYGPACNRAPAAVRALAQTPLSLAFDGTFAVVVFFVLSGFVLTHSYFRNPRPQTLTSAAVRRYFRLAGPVFTSVLLSYALMRAGAYRSVEAAGVAGSSWLGSCILMQPRLFDLHVGAITQGLFWVFLSYDGAVYNNALWTLSFELFGSYLVFAFLALFAGVRRRWFAYGAVGLALLATDKTHMFEFLLGTAACDAYVVVGPLRVARAGDLRWGVWVVIGISACLACDHRLYLPGFAALPGVPYQAPIAAGIVVLLPLFSRSLRQLVHARPLVWLGRISFGLYLVHTLVIASAGARVYLALRQSADWSHNAAAGAASVVAIAVSLMAGWAMYHVADRPSVALAKWVSSLALGRPPSRAAASPPGPSPLPG